MNTVVPEVIEADEVNRSRLLWIGPDDRGLSLEIVAVQEPDYLLGHPRHAAPVPEVAMSAKYVAGPDIDLDVEVVKDKQGQRITEQRAQQMATDALARAGVGRPSLTRPGARSPEIKARVPEELRDRLTAAARERGTTASTLIREALESHLAS